MRPIDAGETSCRDPVKGLRHSISTRLMKSELQSLPQSNFQNRCSLSRESLLRSHCLQHLCRPTESGPASFEGESFDVALFRFSLSHEPFGRASCRTERMPSLTTNKRRVLLCTQRAKSNLEHALNAMAEAATPKSAKASRALDFADSDARSKSPQFPASFHFVERVAPPPENAFALAR